MSDFEIDDKTRLDFNNMLKESGASDNTEKIRNLKHSDKIREQVTLILEIKKKYPKLKKAMKDRMIESKCTWLWENYMNIYNKEGSLSVCFVHIPVSPVCLFVRPPSNCKQRPPKAANLRVYINI